jgi:V8-like Glu-specific endopeptidase
MIKKALLGAFVGSLVACASAPTEDLGTNAASIIHGTNSDTSQDAVVMIMIYDPGSQYVAFCSGTLLTSKLVLTARHCVSKTDESVACDAQGNPRGGGAIYSDNPVKWFYIFTGPNSPDLSAPTFKADATVAKVMTDGAKNLCNHDVALLELANEVPVSNIMPVRLDSTVAVGDTVTSIGWGVTDKSQMPSVRQQRPGVKVLVVGPNDSVDQAAAPNEFGVGESICEGDSGGPAVAGSGAVTGVVSRGGNGTSSMSNPAAGCEGSLAFNLYSKTAPFKDLILQAAMDVGQTVWQEGAPDPRLAANGVTCGTDADCQSNRCFNSACAADCSTTPCDSGFTCNAQKLCVKSAASHTTTTKSGCAAAPGSSDGTNGVAAGILCGALAIVARRRKKA